MNRTLTALFAASTIALAGCASTGNNADGDDTVAQSSSSSHCENGTAHTGTRIKRCRRGSSNVRTTSADVLDQVGGSSSESGVTGRSSGGPPQG